MRDSLFITIRLLGPKALSEDPKGKARISCHLQGFPLQRLGLRM